MNEWIRLVVLKGNNLHFFSFGNVLRNIQLMLKKAK